MRLITEKEEGYLAGFFWGIINKYTKDVGLSYTYE